MQKVVKRYIVEFLYARQWRHGGSRASREAAERFAGKYFVPVRIREVELIEL